MKASVWVIPVASATILFSSVGVAQLSGVWITSGRASVAASQNLAPEDLKGWMTLQQAADGLGIEVAQLIALIGPASGSTLTPQTAFKDVEAIVPGFELSALREQLRNRPVTSPSRER